jgi:hypothetical protein
MQNNVIYGSFGQARPPQQAPTALSRLPDNSPSALHSRLLAGINVLGDLKELIEDPELPKEIAEPLRAGFQQLESSANGLTEKLRQAHTDDRMFLELQTDLKSFGLRLVDFEALVLHKTGATIEVVESPVPAPTPHPLAAVRPQGSIWNSPAFWLSLSLGVSVLGGLVWWGVYYQGSSDENEPTVRKIEKVKLKRALPAR